MSRLSVIDPNKDTRWDKFVEAHPLGQIYHLSGWKKCLESCFGHIKGNSLVLQNVTDGTIQAGLPAYSVKSWLTGRRLVCAPFATHCDPLVTDAGQIVLFLDELIRISSESNYSYVELKTFKTDALLKDDRFGTSRFYKYHSLPLDVPLDKLWGGFHRSCVKQRISRAEKSGIDMKFGESESDLKEFYRLLYMTRERRSLPPQPYAFLKSLWDAFFESKQLMLMLAQKDGLCIAGLMVFLFKDCVTAEFAASDKRYKDISPNHYLFWHAIQMAHGKGYRVFDFGRTSPLNTSLMDFKKRWGAQETDLAQYYYPAGRAAVASKREEGWKYRIIKRLVSLNLPGSVQERLGGFIYRHLG